MNPSYLVYEDALRAMDELRNETMEMLKDCEKGIQCFAEGIRFMWMDVKGDAFAKLLEETVHNEIEKALWNDKTCEALWNDKICEVTYVYGGIGLPHGIMTFDFSPEGELLCAIREAERDLEGAVDG